MFNDLQSTALTAVGTGMLVASGLVWSLTRPSSPTIMKDADYSCHSVLVDKESQTRKSQFEPSPELRRGECRNIQTLYDVFQCGKTHGKDEPCLGFKPEGSKEYLWVTYSEVDTNAISTGAGIIHRLQQSPGQDTRLGIYMKNCVEWVYIEQGCSRYSMVPVPIYDTLGENSCAFIINHVKCQAIFVDSEKKVNFLFENRARFSDLKYVVCIHSFTMEDIERGRQYGLEIIHFDEIMTAGVDHPQPLLICKPEDVSTIFFTSGTTGTPKGCEITNAALVNTITSAIMLTEQANLGKKQETHLSFLPLTHVYERLVHILMFLYSGKIAFFSGDIRNLIDEMKIIQPTVIFAVPRLLNRIYDKVTSEINKSKVGKMIYKLGLEAKMKEVRRGVIRKNSAWDYVLFKKIQAILGGRIEIILVGSAPISGSVLNFCRAVMGSIVLEGYGQTETTGPVCLTFPGDYIPGQVGPPFPGVVIQLRDVPELDLVVARDSKGEVCIKGPSCIKGYYENAEMTAKLIDNDGWLHTGDVGQWTERGQLRIVDRCKHIFKLAQGEYLAPEKLENVYVLSPLVAQIFVTGDSLKDYCVAIVVPELEGWQALGGKTYPTVNDICQDRESKGILLRSLELIGKQNKLMGFEIVKKVALWPHLMSTENGLMTPTMKLQRIDAGKYFAGHIEAMYADDR